MTENDIAKLKEVFAAESDAEEWIKRLHISEISRGATLFRQGDKEIKLVVILEGIFRCVRIEKNGRETIRAFPHEGMLVTDFTAWLTGVPAVFSMEALEPSRVAVMDHATHLELLKSNPAWTQVFLHHTGKAFASLSKRELANFAMEAKERYEEFLNDHRNILNRLKRKDIASYLGITPAFLSRVSGKTPVGESN